MSEFDAPPKNPFDTVADIAEATRPTISDHNEPRYGVSLLFDIDVSKRNCYNTFGWYGGELTALPRLILIPFYTIAIEIPAEQPGGVVHGESYGDLITKFSGAFDYDAYSATLASNVMKSQTRSAKDCADRFVLDHSNDEGVFGVDVFAALQGLDYKEQANAIFSTVLPAFSGTHFPEQRRTVLGYSVTGPFLDKIDVWLKNEAIQAIDASELSDDFKQRAFLVRNQLVALCSETLSRAESRIARKTDQIQKGDAVGYDQPNYRQPDAPKPPDLLMLAHTNTPPLQEREMARAEKYAAGAQAAATGGAHQSQADIDALVQAGIAKAIPDIVESTRAAVLKEVGLGEPTPPKVPSEPVNTPPPPAAANLTDAAGAGAGVAANTAPPATTTNNTE